MACSSPLWRATIASSRTCARDFTEAAFVVSSLGDPDGEHTRVLANRSPARPGDWVVLDDIAATTRHPTA